jgi:hypothetical protein
MAIVSELNPRRSDNADIGVLLCLVLYKNIVLDRIYLQECVGHYLLSMIELPPDHK